MAENSPLPEFYYVDQSSVYSALSSSVYRACHGTCATCNGPLSSDCLTCKSSFIQSNAGTLSECVTSCEDVGNPTSCLTCHPQCIYCRGPSNQFCTTCREDTIMVDGITTCVPRCTNSTYLASVSGSNYECQDCNPLCLTCNGPDSTDCTQCRGASEIISGRVVCLQSCPNNTYKASNGSCVMCHNLCSGGCSGPTNQDCSSCTDITVSVSETIEECRRSCSSGMEYNGVSDSCELSS